MNVVTAEQMREMDRLAINEYGMPGAVLMENAGAAVVDAILAHTGSVTGKRIAVFCGAGNNGGDGYVIARRLSLLGAEPLVIRLADVEHLTGDALAHLNILTRSTMTRVVPFSQQLLDNLFAKGVDLIVDALLGTGLKNAPSKQYAEAISYLNGMAYDERGRRRIPVYSVDIPSGLHADSGKVPGEAVKADVTVTFARPKVGLYLPPGSELVGKLVIADIGFDWSRADSSAGHALNSPIYFAKLFAPRRQESNKGDFGHVGIIAGSRFMTGAPTLSARAALRSGAGLVTVLTPVSAQPIISAKLDEQMTIGLAENTETGALNEAAFDAIANFAHRANVLCIGPGLTTDSKTEALVVRLLSELTLPLVLDADCLNILAKHKEIAPLRATESAAPWILTPHPGEAARLLGTTVEDVQSNRIGSVRELSSRYRAVVVLKGRYTLIAEPDGTILINETGNPGMASGGMGDALTGLIAGLLAQALKSNRYPQSAANCAARAGVYLHGLAGDLACKLHGEQGLVAGDVIAALPAAMRQLQEQFFCNF